jgi:hypothetical protein
MNLAEDVFKGLLLDTRSRKYESITKKYATNCKGVRRGRCTRTLGKQRARSQGIPVEIKFDTTVGFYFREAYINSVHSGGYNLSGNNEFEECVKLQEGADLTYLTEDQMMEEKSHVIE